MSSFSINFPSLTTEKLIIYSSVSILSTYYIYSRYKRFYSQYVIKNRNIEPSRYEYNKKRMETFPAPVANTWYGFCFSDELPRDTIKEVLFLGHTFILWRDENNLPVCQDAYCIHLGANISSGGIANSQNGCIECPFHRWKFNKNGHVIEIPYNKEPHNCNITRKLKTYPCVEWCGMIMVYYHAEHAISDNNETPEFFLPQYVEDDLKKGNYFQFSRFSFGNRTLSIVDWVDQSSDYSHFHTLHNEFLIPFTMMKIPNFIMRLFPIAIQHQLTCYRGDEDLWKDRINQTNIGIIEKHYIYFSDVANLSWNGKAMETTTSETLECYIGPACVAFHIPFTIATLKAFFIYTPTEGGVNMRVQTYLSGNAKYNPIARFIAWLIVGISTNQLEADTIIIEKKIRLKKPLVQSTDGPWTKVNNWLKQFYSSNSSQCHLHIKNDW